MFPAVVLRLPRGKQLVFDAKLQRFEVPENTRLYKTFFKKILDAEGAERYRKIETRIIVSRPDGPDAPDGSHETRSLFGTYAWNDDETQAVLVTDPLRNGEPFRDRLLTYITDEAKAAEVLAKEPYNKVAALREAGATRSYAIPGSERCIQCHMGSDNHSFVLGLTPLQLARRRTGEGGTYEETSEDELVQLDRMIRWGLIAGLSSQRAVTLLEGSQGASRPPRNQYELAAQGYMLGNCAHCHNPRGFPTTQNPELRDLLDFFPSTEGGGIFQFPLSRTSPRIKRGVGQNIQIPYITPALFDQTQPASGGIYAPKFIANDDGLTGAYTAAPWRSLIYRNVDTPFSYSEDYALFPRMPMNGAGFDCRAPRILGSWMVSIPAVLREKPGCRRDCPQCENRCVDEVKDPVPEAPNPQLYEEVLPSDPRYPQALRATDERLRTYQRGGRAAFDMLRQGFEALWMSSARYEDYCPDTSDIVDSNVRGDVSTPTDTSSLPSLQHELENEHGTLATLAQTTDGVPDRPHWVVTDTTETPGPWYPRRSDWASVLVDHHVDGMDDVQRKAVEVLQDVKLSAAFRAYATTPLPIGTWVKKEGCKFDDMPTVSAVAEAERPWWFEDRIPKPQPTDVIYYQSPGGLVFNEICVNCHGAKFDSRGEYKVSNAPPPSRPYHRRRPRSLRVTRVPSPYAIFLDPVVDFSGFAGWISADLLGDSLGRLLDRLSGACDAIDGGLLMVRGRAGVAIHEHFASVEDEARLRGITLTPLPSLRGAR